MTTNINDIPSLSFASSVESVMIATDADINVHIVLTADDGSVVFDNTAKYSPVDGAVEVQDIDELLNSSVLALVDASRMTTPGPRGTGLRMNITAGSSSASCRLLYMSRPMDGIVPHFATQIRKRNVYRGQQFPLSVVTAGQQLKVVAGVAYRDGAAMKYAEKELEVDSSSDYYTMEAGTNGVFSLLKAMLSDERSIASYTLTLYSAGGQQFDKITCTVKDAMPRQATQFVFLSFYGVPETFTFVGRDEEKQSLDSDFGFAGREYVRLDPSLVEEHEANSGWITLEERATVYDLMESPLVYVVDGGELHRVAITDVDSSIERPTNEPDAIALTWRYADTRYMRRPVSKPDTDSGHVFSRPPFDRTFN